MSKNVYANEIPNYDDWKLDTPDNHLKVICHCDYCGGDIYKGENYIIDDNNRFHEECAQ